jgi:3-oxoacyl-[acyl-carrier-protein] synthase II
MTRVVITGMGVLTPIGIGLDDFWAGLKEGKNGIDYLSSFDPAGLSTTFAGEIKDYKPKHNIKLGHPFTRFYDFLLDATLEALTNADLTENEVDLREIGIVLGTSRGAIGSIIEAHKAWQDNLKEDIHHHILNGWLLNGANVIASTYNIKGPVKNISAACASGTLAIGEAYKLIKDGGTKVVITGGVDSPLNPLLFAGSCATKAMSQRNGEPQRACRPFNLDRDGYVMAEGAGILVLEDLDHALQRNTKIYGEIIGYGNTCDAYHITAPEPEGNGLAAALEKAFTEAAINKEEIGYINAHGTSTKLNDLVETEVIKKVFGVGSYEIPISSIKSMTGHLLGAAGAVETIGTIMALNNQWIPPTINFINPDPICDLDYVPNIGRSINFEIAVKQSVGFGGQNGVLIIKKWPN